MTTQIQLNHFITDLHQPNKSPLEILKGKISNLQFQSKAAYAVRISCYVALVATVALAFAVSYNFLVLGSSASLVVTALVLGSPFLMMGANYFANLSNEYAARANVENRTFLKYKEIENWTELQIDQFITDQELNPKFDALRQINQNEPKKALLPLIARFQATHDRIQEIQKEMDESPKDLEDGFQKKLQEGALQDIRHQKLRFDCQCTQWRKQENEAMPLLFQAATLLRIIENPESTLTFDLLENVIPGVGTCVPRNYPERFFGKTNTPINDDYFYFTPGLKRAPLSHETVASHLDAPHRLKQLLYVKG